MSGRASIRWQHPLDLTALLVSAVAACIAPLQVFILAYAFLGPLHYLTEIAWLGRKDFYFGEGIVSPKVYVTAASLLCLAASLDFYTHRGLVGYAVGLLVVLSLGACVRSPLLLATVLVAGYAAKFFVHGLVLFAGTVLPTVVHVYIFTGCFMVAGLIRARHRTLLAWLNPLLLLTIPAMLLIPAWHYQAPGGYWLKAETGFSGLHLYLAHLLGRNLHPDATIMSNPAAVGVLRVVAFIYLYHYLNWFAKTELLQWHRMSKRQWSTIGALYGLAVGCYLWNFVVGFYIVNFLSLLHVLLEFPLNWQTGRFLAASAAKLGRAKPEQVLAGSTG